MEGSRFLISTPPTTTAVSDALLLLCSFLSSLERLSKSNPSTMIYSIVIGSALLIGSANVHGFAPPSSLSSTKINVPRLVPAAKSALYSYDNKGSSFSVPDIDLSSITDSLSDFDADRVVSNIKGDGEPLGSRGELFAIAQFVLAFCILIGEIPLAGPIFQFM